MHQSLILQIPKPEQKTCLQPVMSVRLSKLMFIEASQEYVINLYSLLCSLLAHNFYLFLSLLLSRCKFFSLTETPEDYTIIVDEDGFKGRSCGYSFTKSALGLVQRGKIKSCKVSPILYNSL